jgi:cell volume regulation protein A
LDVFVLEPHSTALLLLTMGILIGASALFSQAMGKAGIPVAMLFIALGMTAGSEGIGKIAFEDYGLTFRVGMVALALILFDGGLNTPLSAVRAHIKPVATLATLGVVLTGLAVAVVAHWLDIPWGHALLLGAVVSSTDAAAVFSVLRGSGVHLRKRVGLTLELESGFNDPMAVILTTAMTEVLLGKTVSGWAMAGQVVLQLFLGAAVGLAAGYGGAALLRSARLSAGGLYPVLTVALAFFSFGIATLIEGSGFLAVYLCGVIVGSQEIRYHSGVLRVHDALAWLSQVTMFLMMGLLAFPSRLTDVAFEGIILALALAFIARPLAVALCLLPFRYKATEIAYVGWVGLRGAVPIILATYPVLLGVEGAGTIFNVVFFIVVLSSLIPGATVQPITRMLGLVSSAPPPPSAVLEIHSTQPLNGQLVSFFIGSASAACGATLADLPFPPSSVAALIVRGREVIAPKGGTTLLEGDHVYVVGERPDLPFLQLIFGQQEQE